jgi:hypothetical protein
MFQFSILKRITIFSTGFVLSAGNLNVTVAGHPAVLEGLQIVCVFPSNIFEIAPSF